MNRTLNRRGKPREERGKGHTQTHSVFFYRKLSKMVLQLEKLTRWLPNNHETTKIILRMNEIRQTIGLGNVERRVPLARLIAEVHQMLRETKAACKERGRQLSRVRRGSRPRQDRPGPNKKAQERQLAPDAARLHENRAEKRPEEEPVRALQPQQVDREERPVDPDLENFLRQSEAAEARRAG